MWETILPIYLSPYGNSGVYNITCISVQNEALQMSADWPGDVTFGFTGMGEGMNDIPGFVSLTQATQTITNGNYATFTLQVSSKSPVNFLNLLIVAPNGRIVVGGGGYQPFQNTSLQHLNSWTLSYKYYLNPYVPSGSWTFNISVTNDAEQDSDVFQAFYKVANTFVAQPPNLKMSVDPHKTTKRQTIDNQLGLDIVLNANCNTNVNGYSFTIIGPQEYNQTSQQSVMFSQIFPNQYQYNLTVSIPSIDGKYTITDSFVDSVGLYYSPVYPNVFVTVQNGQVVSIQVAATTSVHSSDGSITTKSFVVLLLCLIFMVFI